MRTRFGAERRIDAPAEVIYHLLADYREHHSPDGFLPSAFSHQEVLEGGVGAGTWLRYALTTGGRRRVVTSLISEPVPGRMMVETADGVETTVTIEPAGDGTDVRFDTVLDARGVEGLMTRLFGRRLLAPIYEDELDRLARLAQEHPALEAATAAVA